MHSGGARLACRGVVKLDTERFQSSVSLSEPGLRCLFLQDICSLARGMHEKARHGQDSVAQPRYGLRTGTQVRERCRNRARGAIATSTRGTLLRTSRVTLDSAGAIGQRPLIRPTEYGFSVAQKDYRGHRWFVCRRLLCCACRRRTFPSERVRGNARPVPRAARSDSRVSTLPLSPRTLLQRPLPSSTQS